MRNDNEWVIDKCYTYMVYTKESPNTNKNVERDNKDMQVNEDDFIQDKIKHRRKHKLTNGKVHKSRCGIKKLGGKCDCGVYGKKIRKQPKGYRLDTELTRTINKWKKKYAFKVLNKIKGIFNKEVDD